MGFRIPVQAQTVAALNDRLTPKPGQLEAVPHVFFDTLTYTDNTTTSLSFFQSVQTDKSLGNMRSAGQLPSPQYFVIHYLGLDILRSATTSPGGITGVYDDIQLLVMSGRGYFQLTVASKAAIGPIPVSFLHTSGGAVGFNAGTWTAEENITFANNSIPDGGFYVGGSVIIPPKEAFDVEMIWPAAVNLTADAQLRFWMAGTLYRSVR